MRRTLITFAAVIFAVFGLAAPSSATTPADEKPVVLVNEKGESVLSVPVRASEVGILAFSDCPSSYSCYWTGTGGSGSRWDAPSCSAGGYWQLEGTSFNNNIESVRNRGGGTVHLYDDNRGTVYLTSIVNNGAGVTLATNIRNRTTTIRIDC
ncbi:peptidase inhibitor family I36 protein [Nonomuraea sp. NPDC003707]